MILLNRVCPFRHGDCKLRKSTILTGSAQFVIQILSPPRNDAVNVFLCVLFAVIQRKTLCMIIDYQQN